MMRSLTRKQLRILFMRDDVDPLKAFTQDLYYLLYQHSPTRDTFPRELQDERLDAFSRLLVGDETCVAMAMSGDQLYLTTNKIGHNKDFVRYNIFWRWKTIYAPWRASERNFVFSTWGVMSLNNGQAIKIPGPDVTFTYSPARHRYEPDRAVSFTLPRDRAENILPIPVEGDLSFSVSFRNFHPIPPLFLVNFMGQNYSMPFAPRTSFNPLQRRVETVLHYLGFILLVETKIDAADAEARQRAQLGINSQRANVLNNSLAWEMPNWYGERFKSGFGVGEKNAFREFIERLNNHYNAYKDRHRRDAKNSGYIDAWVAEVVVEIDARRLAVPPYILLNPAYFMKRAKRYFLDIERIAEYLIQAAEDDPDNSLVQILLQTRPWEEVQRVNIIDAYDDEVHAEMRLFKYTKEHGLPVKYIATSKLCCAHCRLALSQHGIKAISGIHGKAFARWNYESLLDDEFLQTMLDESLYKKYLVFKNNDTTGFTFLNGINTWGDLALSIINSVAVLQQDDLTALGVTVPVLMNREEDLADESDDEDFIARQRAATVIQSRWRGFRTRKSLTRGKRARTGEQTVVFSGLFAESSGDDQRQRVMQQSLEQALAETDRAFGEAISEGDCFFDAFAQSLNEARETDVYTVESLRRLCSDYAMDLERQHPVYGGNTTEATQAANWIFQALGKNVNLYGEYVIQGGWTAQEAKLMQDQFRIGNGLAVWGEQHIDACILCAYFGVTLHVLEVHEEHFDRSDDIPLILHQVVDAEGVHQIEMHPVENYQNINILHLRVWHNHFVPILKQSTLREMAEKTHVDDDSSGISEDWRQWAASILGSARLPQLGLPTRWDETEAKHIKIAFDPITKETVEIESGKVIGHKRSPVGFITATHDASVMPGTNRPASVRYTRYLELLLNRNAIVEDAHGHKLAPCIVDGSYVQVAALQADHAQAKAEIERRQRALVEKLNTEPAFAAFLMRQEGMDKFFVQVDGTYYGTLFFYELYFNDIDNIWLICDACNLHKSDQDTVEWLDKQWLYGPEFKDYLGEVDDRAILAKTQTKQGLAEVAIEWFWKRHANYILTQKKILEEVVKPIQILGITIDRIVGRGQKRRAERKQASLEFRVRLLAEIAKAPGLEMPRRPSESPQSSSDANGYLDVRDAEGRRLQPTEEEYVDAGKELLVEEATGIIRDAFAAKVAAIIQRSADEGGSSDSANVNPK